MAEVKAAPPLYGAPAAVPGSEGRYVQKTPTWVVVVRGLQALFGLVILALCGYLIHGKAMDANVFALVVCLMTWVVVFYALGTEKVPSAQGAYNIWAILALDLLLAIFWLSSLGANAAQRASFKYDVNVEYCYNDGSTVNSNFCYVSKRDLEKRAAVAGTVGLAVMSAIAGLSALMLLLFIATLVFHGHTFRMYQEGKKSAATSNGSAEAQAQQTPMLAPQQGSAPVYPAYPAYPAYADYPSQTQPQPQGYPQAYPQPTSSPPPVSAASPAPSAYTQAYPQPYPQPAVSPAPVSAPSPAPHELPHNLVPQKTGPYQLPGSQPHNGHPSQQAQYQQQVPQQPYYSPQGTPVPGQPYYPPAQ